MIDRPAFRSPRPWQGFPFLVHRPRRWRRVFALASVLVAIAGPWLYALGRNNDDSRLPGALVLIAWILIGGLAKDVARPLITRDPGLYRRAVPIANRLLVRGILPVGGLLLAAAAVAGSELLLAAVFYLGFPGILLVTRLIELVALWIAPDGQPRIASTRAVVVKRS